MRLTWKIAATIAITISVVLGVEGYLRVQRQFELFEQDIERDHLSMGRATAAAITEAWLSQGEPIAMDLLKRIEKKTKRVTLRWIDWPLVPDIDKNVELSLAAGETASVVGISTENQAERVLITYVPVSPEGETVGVVEIRESLAPQKQYVRTTVRRMLVTTIVTITICVAATFLLGLIFVGRPVKKLVRRARAIGTGDFSGRVDFHQKDEIGDLAEEMDRMAGRLDRAMKQIELETTARQEALEQLRHADRMKTIGQLTSGVVHEIGTPLTVISGRAKMVATGEVTGDEAKKCARIVVEQTERVTKTLRQVLAFARKDTNKKEDIDLGCVVSDTVELLVPVAVKRGIILSCEIVDDGPYRSLIDKNQVEQVLANLIMNGIQAAKASGTVCVTLKKGEANNPRLEGTSLRPHMILSIADDGDGIEPELIQRIFEPFYTTKALGEGTGLGLAISQDIVREHAGWIAVKSEMSLGSTFTVYLPGQEEGA